MKKKSIRIQSSSGPYFVVVSLNAGKYGLEKLRIRTLFTQCRSLASDHYVARIARVAEVSDIELFVRNSEGRVKCVYLNN